ncbi:STAS domain-containing protein [Marinactinospora rubrisoli]|uniref:STAS domain-containing protein n=1 Tax=Marinactinospora rubrisoli TaxID=2715399 RepID=A0ABW2KAR7_9ACTN
MLESRVEKGEPPMHWPTHESPDAPPPTRPSPMRLTVERPPSGSAVAFVSGELDIATTGDLAFGLVQALDRHGPRLIVDVSAVVFCDAPGLSALVHAANHAERLGGRITLRRPNRLLTRILRLTGLDGRFHLVGPAADVPRGPGAGA